jgi:hypothetical protein
MYFKALQDETAGETLPIFAVERCIGPAYRRRWQPVGLFRAADLDGAIEKAAFAIGRPALLRATRLLL